MLQRTHLLRLKTTKRKGTAHFFLTPLTTLLRLKFKADPAKHLFCFVTVWGSPADLAYDHLS